MRNKRILIVGIFTFLCCVLFAAYYIITDIRTDKISPVINMPDGIIEIPVEAEAEDILAGITAYDDRDGDVTDSLVFENIASINEDNTTSVIVAAFDSSGNVAKTERIVKFTNYHKPRFTLSAPLVFRENSSVDIFTYVGAEDILAGDISERVKGILIEGGMEGYITDNSVIQFRVTNNLSDTSYIELPVRVYGINDFNADVSLDTYIIYIKKNGSFNAKSHLLEFKYGLHTIDLQDPPENCEIQIETNVNPKVCGVYSAEYFVTMDQYKGCSRIFVVVED